MIICVDFDGTLVEHDYPRIGREVPGAFAWLRRFRAAGTDLILWTMRSDTTAGGEPRAMCLTDAVEFCRERGVEFFGVNRNPGQTWSTSPKAYAHVYIDDAAAFCPLIESDDPDGRPYVDWSRMGPEVLSKLPPTDYASEFALFDANAERMAADYLMLTPPRTYPLEFVYGGKRVSEDHFFNACRIELADPEKALKLVKPYVRRPDGGVPPDELDPACGSGAFLSKAKT